MTLFAEVMKSLGAVEAMNLDGGASSGLVYGDNYITRTGRDISNALLVFVDEGL
jgi:exopolysaccharide biosynthesis protein